MSDFETRRATNRQTLEDLKTGQRDGTRHVSDEMLAQAQRLVELDDANAASIARREAEALAKQEQKQAELKAFHDNRVKQAQDAYQRQARARFPGTDEEFTAAWPALLQDWQLRAARGEQERPYVSPQSWTMRNF